MHACMCRSYSEPWMRNICFAHEGSDSGAFTDVHVRGFLHDFCSGALSPADKSQAFAVPPLPDGSLQRIHGQAFEQVVLDPTKDVLVYFYSTANDAAGGMYAWVRCV